jgi:pseudaminic acid synthase
MRTIRIAGKKIGEGCPVFIIAELSANHMQKFDIAVKTIKAMKKAGADAVKFQTFTPDTITLNSDKSCFRLKGGSLWDGKTLYELYRRAYSPWEWQPELKKIAEGTGLICFSTPFDRTSVDFLKKMAVPAYKIASFEITDTPLIEYAASKGKPVILSTGIAGLKDIRSAVAACRAAGNDQIAILKCTSSYPAGPEEYNLLTIPDMARRFNAVVGLSDHSLGSAVPVAAVSLGARIVEKHFILDRRLGGPDASFSAQPGEFRDMVGAIRNAEKAIGKVSYSISAKARQSRKLCRSIFTVKDIVKGEVFTDVNVRSIRPGNGLPPKYIGSVLGSKAAKNIPSGTPLRWRLVNKRPGGRG